MTLFALGMVDLIHGYPAAEWNDLLTNYRLYYARVTSV